MLMCTKCRITDEIVALGHLAVARYRKQLGRNSGLSKRDRKRISGPISSFRNRLPPGRPYGTGKPSRFA